MNAIAPNTVLRTPGAQLRYRSELFETASERHAAFLDAAVPLKCGSHADVVRYNIDVPMRYAECFAVLRDGRTVPLANKRSFVAWSGRESRHSLMFEAHGLRIEAMIDPYDRAARSAPGHVAKIDIQSTSTDAPPRQMAGSNRRFIATDGAVFA